MKKVSIITTTYNDSAALKKTIEQIKAQDYPNIEYIIVDGASSDNTAEVAKSFVPEFVKRGINYIIISEPDKGMYDALNKGAQRANGDIVGQINADDWYESDALERWQIFMKKSTMMLHGEICVLLHPREIS